jgi:hypothetical protein
LTTNCSIYSTSSGIYDSVGAAGYYLASGSTNRAAGTAGIEAGLLADLQTLTTYPPTVIPNNVYITTSTILSQQAGRYSGIPDIGYCYSPIDWAIDSAVTNAGVTVSPGTVLAGYGAYGIVLWGTASLTFNGTANSPCYFVKYNTVQEQSNVSWEESQSSWDGCLEIAGTGSVTSEFTDWSVLAGDSLIAHYQNLASLMAAQNCQFYNGVVSLTGQTLVSSNCLYQRVATSVTEAGIESEDNTFANNLLWNGSLTVKHNGTGTWTFRDNLFDQTLIWTNSPGKYIDICSNNAYMMNSGVTTLTNLLPANHDVTLTASPSYQTGILGQFYYPSTEASLIFRGSQSATNAGLYYYTVTTNNQIDGTSNVSIGFHYATPPAPVITSQPESVVTTVNGSATFSVTAWGAPPLSYQWYSNGVALSGYTNSTLTLSGVPAWAAGAYQVEVTDPLGTTMSGVVTLKVAQNDFYVNYWNPNAVSPINTMLGGMTGADFFTPAERFPIIQATTNSSMRGVEAGTFAQGYNWMRLTSQQIDVNYTNGYGANSVTPVTTLDMLKDASTNGTSLVFTVNCLGDGYIIPNYTYGTNSYTNVFSVTNSSITFLSTLASNWVRYANFLVQNYCWSNAVVVPYGANPTSLGYSDGVLITNIHNNWVAIANGQTTYLPTLQTYPNLATNLPKVMYWEIGNEVESPLPSQYYAITNTNMVLTNYVNLYTNIRAAMLGADSTIKIGPGFGNGFTNGTIATGANTIINPLFANTNVSMDFIVYHPYPADPTSDWMNGTNGNISGLVSDLEGIWDWQDVERNSMYGALAANQRQFNIPLLATEYSGDSAESASFSLQASMWTLLANTETVLAMAKGQQTLGAEYWIGADTYADWELLFTRFQSNLGNVFLSCSDGDGVVPQLWSAATTNTAAGSTQSPFRVYSTINTNSGNGTLSVWMLNLQNTSSQTVDLHLPGAASSGTLFTLGCPNAPPSLINQGAFTDITNIPFSGGTNFVWSNTSITIAGSNAIVMTNPPATVSVAQFWLASTPSSPVAPTITAVPVNGHPGQIITITGTQFSPNALQDIVYFGGVRGVVTSATSTTLNVQVPFGASYGPVTVTVSNLTAYSTNFFNPAYYGPGVSSPIVMSGSWVASINPLNPFFATTNLVIHGVGFFDADGDGKGDVAYLAPNVAAIVENGSTGPGNFDLWSGAPYSLPIGAQPSAMAAGDLDGDGLLDWVVLGYNLNNLQIFRNASAPQNISFAMGGTYLTGNSPWDVKIADIDGDGRPDIIVANYSDNTVSVLRNISTGQGNIAFAQATNFPACGTPYALAVGDIDGDGKPDIAVEGYVSSGSNVVVLRNTSTPGTISFTSPIAIIPTNLPYAESIALGDFNADGKLDIAVGANQLTFPGIFICINASTPGSISFNSAAYVAQVTDPRDIAIADYNGDGQLDFAAVDGSSDLLYTFQSKWTSGTFSSSSFTASSAYSAGSSSVADSIRLIAGDIDGDGRPDLIVGDFNGMDVVLFQNISQY